MTSMEVKDKQESIEETEDSPFEQYLSYKNEDYIYPTLFNYLNSVASELGVDKCFYTMNFADILMKVEIWKTKMPNFKPYYAVKTNSEPALLRFFMLLGFSFDCASEGEIQMVMEAGGDGENVIFAHVIKTPGALKYAEFVGVNLMTFDSEEELLKIQKYHSNSRLLLRLAPQHVTCSFDLSHKFGCEEEEAGRVLTTAMFLNLDVVGVSFHVGGLCKNPISFKETIQACRRVFNTAEELGFEFNVLDIGGGFSGQNGQDELFAEMTDAIKSSVEEHFPGENVELIAEPGTFFAGSAVTLTTGICGKKKRIEQVKLENDQTSSAIERYYYLNDSIYGSFYVGLEEYGFKPKPLLEESDLKQRPEFNSTLWGQSCCGNDLVLKSCVLPDMEEGEFLVWENMGAYCRVLCSTFCGVPLPATKCVFVKNNRLTLDWLTNAEEIADFLADSCTLIENE